MKSPLKWYATFLESRGLNEPNGNPLWSYRVSNEEFTELEHEIMPQVFQGKTETGTQNKLFLLYAAESWKRRYEGGHWTWDIVFGELGYGGKDHANNQAYARDRIKGGYRGWKLGTFVAGAKGYIGAVYVQAGIPEKILEAGHSYHLEQFLIDCLERARQLGSRDDIETIVGRKKETLPESIRHDQFADLIKVLIESIYDLIEDFGLTSADEPVSWLDSQAPEWRDRLPISVSSDAINDFLSRIVKKGASFVPDREFIFERMYLRQGHPNWDVYSSIDITKVANKNRMAKWLGCELDELDHFYYLEGSASGKSFRIASFMKSARVDGHYEVELKSARRRFGAAAFDTVTYQLLDENRKPVRVGSFFSDLPKSFELPLGFEPRVNRDFAYVASGRIATKSPRVVVIVNDGVSAFGESDVRQLGKIPVLDGEVFSVSGIAEAIHSGDSYRVRTGFDDNLPEFSPLKFVQLPFLEQSKPVIGDTQMEAIDDGFFTGWTGKTSGGLGRVQIFYKSKSGERDLVWSKQAVYLPNDPRVELRVNEFGSLELVFRDFPLSNIHVRNGDENLAFESKSLLNTSVVEIQIPDTKPPFLDVIGLLPDGNSWHGRFLTLVDGLSATIAGRKAKKVALSELAGVDISLYSRRSAMSANVYRYLEISTDEETGFKINLPSLCVETSVTAPASITVSDVIGEVERLGRYLSDTKESVRLVIGTNQTPVEENIYIKVGLIDVALKMSASRELGKGSVWVNHSFSVVEENSEIGFVAIPYSRPNQRHEFWLNAENNWSVTIDLVEPTFIVPTSSVYSPPRLITPPASVEFQLGPFAQSFTNRNGSIAQEFVVATENGDIEIYRDIRLIYMLTKDQPPYVSNEWKKALAFEYVATATLFMLALDTDQNTNLETEFHSFWNFAEDAGVNWSTIPQHQWVRGLQVVRGWVTKYGFKGLALEICANVFPVFEQRLLSVLAARGRYFAEIANWLRLNVSGFDDEIHRVIWLANLERTSTWTEAYMQAKQELFELNWKGSESLNFFTKRVQMEVSESLAAEIDSLMPSWKEKVRHANDPRTRLGHFLLTELPVLVGLSNSGVFPGLLAQSPSVKVHVDWVIDSIKRDRSHWVEEAMLFGFRLGMVIHVSRMMSSSDKRETLRLHKD